MRNYFFIVLLVFTGCKSHQEKVMADFKKVDSSLNNASQNIETANRHVAEVLKNDSGWVAFNNESAALTDYIETVKERIKKVSGKIDTEQGLLDVEAGNRVMFEQKKSDTVFALLKKFQSLACLKSGVDSTIKKVNNQFRYLSQPKKEWEAFFKNVPAAAVLTMLSKFQNDIQITRNIILPEALIKSN